MYFYAIVCLRAIGIVIGLALIGTGIYQVDRRRKVAKYGTHTTALITKLSAGRTLIPTIRFVTLDQQVIEVEVDHNLIATAMIRIGSEVTVSYNPHNPKEVVIISELGSWYFPFSLIFLGIFLIIWVFTK